jgi:choline kinase
MKAVILAGGRGTRMGDKGLSKPKCLLSIAGKPIIQYQIDALKRCNINDIIVVTGFKSELIKKELGDSVTYVHNKDYFSTNSAYGLWLTKDLVIDDGFIALNSDLIFHTEILKELINSAHPNAIMVDEIVRLDSGMLKVVIKDGTIHKMAKDVGLDLAHADAVGPVKISSEGAKLVFNRIDELIKNEGKKDAWHYSIYSDVSKLINFKGISLRDFPWVEIDTEEDLILAEKIIHKIK